ncbi:MAG TPA: protein kinase [Blastocatellia bacterium]|nr:protein kinase [Blastocatellia bacterium]HMV82522.1 protein kinase [Blastocatellia bacterium]HMZ18908.1 protein kinase [Blastocatellia bacterium]HNG30105.1 protein kinase [Blastocatellia bacterium]
MTPDMTPERWQRIEKLYHEALELDAGRRAAFLETACASDDALRREIEDLLAANDQTDGILDGHALSVEAQALAAENKTAAIQDFSHYRILSKLGAGGMGEVFLARDERLERPVAIKILPPQFTADPSRLQRFAREAKAASALNHPNIITIYEIGETETPTGQTHFIVTEFIEGETLRARMARGPELREALNVAIQAVSALDAAHQAGIIHRDIKPENLMIRPDGLVKVLDFGLAKLGARKVSPFDSTDTDAQTAESGLKTEQGTIMGTLRYMSPEQARGRELDARSDVFSLGVVLYEMITRRPLFAGETSADVIAAIIHKQPQPLVTFAPDTPEELERIVRKALAKDCAERYQTAREFLDDLQSLKQELEFQVQLSRSGQSRTRHFAAAGRGVNQRAVVFVSVALIALIAALLAWKTLSPSSPAPFRTTRRVTNLLSERTGSGGKVSRAEFSPPDGKLIAYSISRETGSALWLKQFAGGEARQITDGKWLDRNPIWSPDGQLLAFISNRGGTQGIWSIPYLGGEAPKLLKAMELGNGTLVAWAKNGRTIYFESGSDMFALDLASDAAPRQINFAPKTAKANGYRLSPDETQLVYADFVNEKFQLLTLPVQGGVPRQITFGEGSNVMPSWFPDGRRLVFVSDRTSRKQLYLTSVNGGEPEPLIFSNEDHTLPTVSPDGNRIISNGERENANIYSCDLRTGKELGHTSELGIQLFPEVSFDGRQIAFQSSNASINADEAIVYKPVSPDGTPLKLPASGFNAKWSPREDRLAFLKISNGKIELWRAEPGGGNPVLLAGAIKMAGQTGIPYYRMAANYDWSPDGVNIAYSSAKSGQENLWMVRGNDSAETKLTENTDPKLQVSSPFWSPDGRRIAFLSGASPYLPSGNKQLCIFDQGKTEVRFETEAPVKFLGWSASGKELYLARGKSAPTRPQPVELLKVQIESGATTIIHKFDSAYLYSPILSFDKQQIAVTTRREDTDNVEIVSIANGSVKRATNNSDTTTYYSGITWSPDGKILFYSKQQSWVLLSLIENSEK